MGMPALASVLPFHLDLVAVLLEVVSLEAV
jgi:hypothetical protein